MPDPTGRISHLPEMHRGVAWKEPCRVATTANITISTALNNGDTIDGITLATGDRVLVKDQSTGSQNGIYVVGASPARAYDMDQDGTTAVPAEEVMGAFIYVIAGTTNGGKIFYNTNTSAPTLGTTSLTFAQFTGSALTDHTHAATGSGSNGGGATLSPGTLNLPTATSPAQTADGQAVWDSDDDVLTIGDGSSRKTIGYLGTTTPSVESGAGSAGSAKETSRADHVHPAAGGSGTLSTVEEVDGSPTDSAVTKLVFPNGTLSIASHVATYTPAGGGGSAKYPFDTNYFDETKPGSANATYDDEFDDGSGMSGTGNGLNARWNWRNQSTSTATFGKAGWVTMSIPASASASYRIIENTAFANGTYEAKVSLESTVASGDAGGGIVLVDGTNGDLYVFVLVDTTGNFALYVQAWSSVTAFSSTVASRTTEHPNFAFLRVVKSGTSIECWYSFDGIGWVRLASFTDSVSATRIGLGCYETKNTGLTKMHVDYFRKVA